MADNSVTLVGNVTDDPELRFTPSGQAVANFTVAVNRRIRGSDGSWDDKLDGFFRCSCWREMAEHAAESLKKGTRVILTGRLQQRSWETNEGERRSTMEIQVDEIGPSLRWASAQVNKSRRSTGGFQDQAGSQEQGGPSRSGSGPQQQPQPATGEASSDWGTPAGSYQPEEGSF